ncbi:DNA repair protein RadA [Chromobacterium violaceum]|uniref:DNA repair protein RadA n=1 Tax=Chromobacterium violaceum TaxID=536 RepID=A0A3S4HJX8_CHRVL|nr:DNA repair protein RadA [Chromobacterium violaceum]
MAKNKTVFSCTECGGQSPKWQGQCPHCSAWNTLVEAVAAPAAASPRFQSWAANVTKVQKLSEVQTEETRAIRPASTNWTACWAAASCAARWC